MIDLFNRFSRIVISRGLMMFGLLAPITMVYADTITPKQTIELSDQHIQNLGVVLGKLNAAERIPTLYAPATVTIPPDHEVLVSSPQSGLIIQLTAAIGDRVRKGAVLARLNSPDLLSLQRLYLQSENELSLNTLLYQRDKKLMEEGVISERRWQETRTVYQSALSNRSEHKQLLKIAGMTEPDINRLNSSRNLTSELAVRAPIDGVVIDRLAVTGDRVDVQTPLYRLANLDVLWLEVNIPQERIADVHLGDIVEVDAYSEPTPPRTAQPIAPVTASITLLGAAVNTQNQTIMARAIVTSQASKIRPGQRLNTHIVQNDNEQSAFQVPDTAIAQYEGKPYIFIRNSTGFIVMPVGVVGKYNDHTIIQGELTGTETIAVSGAVALKANWLGLGSDE